MHELDDWSQLTDADGEPYDARPALTAIIRGETESGFAELWDRVHHQGDLGTAAYAVVAELVGMIASAPKPDWQAYAFIATVEERRHADNNPAVPKWLNDRYQRAWQDVLGPAFEHLRAAQDDLEVRSILATLAQAKGQRTIGSIALWTEGERQEALGEVGSPLI